MSNLQMTADIGVAKLSDGVKVVAASLWDNSGQDYPTLQGMVGQLYGNKSEIRNAVYELVSANAEENNVKVAVKFYDAIIEGPRRRFRQAVGLESED